MQENKTSPGAAITTPGETSDCQANCSTPYRQQVNTPILVQGKIVGHLDGRTFLKRVLGSRHQLRRPRAWCLSAQVFEEQIRPCATEIVVEDTESSIVYRTSLETFVRHCFEIQRGSFERQLGLALKHWDTTASPRRQLSLAFEGGARSV